MSVDDARPAAIDVREAQQDLKGLLRRVQDGERLVITERGREVAMLLPVEPTSEHLIGALRGRLRVCGDTRSTGIEWNARATP